MEKLKIENGINLHVIDVKKFKTTTILVLFRQPLSRKSATKNALTANIIKNGSARYDKLSKLNAVVEDMYGAVFESQIVKKGEEQILQLYLDIIDGYDLFDQGIDFLREIIFNPLLDTIVDGQEFSKAIIENEKVNLKKVIEGRKNNKTEYAKLRCIEEMCRNEPFGVYADGYADDLDDINNIYNNYKSILSDSLIEVIIVGNKDNIGIDKVKRLFKDAERAACQAIIPPEYRHEILEIRRINEESGTAQGKLCLGYRANISPIGDMYYSLMVANEIFGGGTHSKLFKNARENESLCYYINSSLYRFKSMIIVQTGTNQESFNKIIELSGKCVEALKNGSITEDELLNAKLSIKNRLTGINDYQSAIADFYLTQSMLDDYDDILDKIEMVDSKSVCESFQNVALDTVYSLT